MDVSQLHQQQQQQWSYNQPVQSWPTPEANQCDYYYDAYLDALGKGKGWQKGKGSYGKAQGKGKSGVQCYNCGETGHMAYECPKGKGKGKGAPTCWNCGQEGHQQWACPHQAKGKSKGKGKPSGKAWGKGAYAVGTDYSTIFAD